MKHLFHCLGIVFKEIGGFFRFIFNETSVETMWETFGPLITYGGGTLAFTVFPIFLGTFLFETPTDAYGKPSNATLTFVFAMWFIQAIILGVGIRTYQVCKELKNVQ